MAHKAPKNDQSKSAWIIIALVILCVLGISLVASFYGF